MFGCWNYDNCDKVDYRSNILKLVREDKTPYNFGIITGDNIYPIKNSEGEKLFYKNTFRKLYELNTLIPNGLEREYTFLNVILGNHDEEDSKCVLEEERRILGLFDNLKLYETNFIVEKPLAYYVYINTNEMHLSELIKFLEKIDEKIEQFDTNKWFIFIGHNPLYSFKYKIKKDKHPNYTELHPEIIKIVNKIYLNGLNKMLYLCADTHNFQLINIINNDLENEFCLPIVIVGTGGAKLDSIFLEDMDYDKELEYMNTDTDLIIDQYDEKNLEIKRHLINNNKYTMYLEHCLKKYGYSSIKINKDSVNIKFNTCDKQYNYKIYYLDQLKISFITDFIDIQIKPKVCKLSTIKCANLKTILCKTKKKKKKKNN